jgi:hypothetical protein
MFVLRQIIRIGMVLTIFLELHFVPFTRIRGTLRAETFSAKHVDLLFPESMLQWRPSDQDGSAIYH